MKKIILFLLSFLVLQSCHSVKQSAKNNVKEEKNYVLLVSFDGFRYDYPDKFNLPNFKKLREISSYAPKGILSGFPSKTFPNHYSIITGMYPGTHGLVDNKFISKKHQNIYSIPDRKVVQDGSYYGGVPLWQQLQKHGIKTASYFWVGSEAEIAGDRPLYFHIFNSKVPNQQRIEGVKEWFSLEEEKRPQFVSLYFEFIDTVGHHTGTSSKELEKDLLEADRLLGEIIKMVNETELPITTIITSDHGMIDMHSNEETFVFLDDIQKKLSDKAQFINNGMHCQIYVKDEKNIDEVYKTLKDYFAKTSFLSVYKKQETPKNWHYSSHPNIGDIVMVVSAPHYMIGSSKEPIFSKKGTWGTHGFDPHTTPEMAAIFYAFGKNIKRNNPIQQFENVNIYPFITEIFGVKPPKDIDGKVEVLKPILIK